MLKLIEEIENVLDDGNIRCALGMALTLPDICGQIEYPEESKVGDRYIKWCDKYLYNQGFFPEWGEDNNTGELVRERVIQGDICYLLRCAFLHSGNLQLRNIRTCFHLIFTTSEEKGIYKEQIRTNNSGDIEDIFIDARYLCRVLCNAANEYYQNSNNKMHFNDHQVIIEDREIYFIIKEHEEEERARGISKEEYEEKISKLSEPALFIYTQIRNNKWNDIKEKILTDPELRKGFSELFSKNMIKYNLDSDSHPLIKN